MAEMPKAELEITGPDGQDFRQYTAELCAWQPPRYRWRCEDECGAYLSRVLNQLDQDGWEIFQVLHSYLEGKYRIIARQPIEEETPNTED